MAVGTVKFFNAQQGYGFIRPDDGSTDVFVHVSAVRQSGLASLSQGQRISYEAASLRGSPTAMKLEPASAS